MKWNMGPNGSKDIAVIEFYLSDFNEATRKELEKMWPDNNWDTFPVTVLDIEYDEDFSEIPDESNDKPNGMEFQINNIVSDSCSTEKEIYDKDPRMLAVCKLLSEKGYETWASCEGHPEECDLCVDEKTGYLTAHMDAYIAFAKHVNFPKPIPKLWVVDISPIDYERSIRWCETTIRWCNDLSVGDTMDQGRYVRESDVATVHPSFGMLPLRKATDEEMENCPHNISEISDREDLINLLEKKKDEYMTEIEAWAKSLPIIKESESRENFIKFSEGNIYPDPISDREALDILQTFFLGEDWYIVDPVSPGQANVYLVDAILKSFPRKYKKFRKNMGWDK